MSTYPSRKFSAAQFALDIAPTEFDDDEYLAAHKAGRVTPEWFYGSTDDATAPSWIDGDDQDDDEDGE